MNGSACLLHHRYSDDGPEDGLYPEPDGEKFKQLKKEKLRKEEILQKAFIIKPTLAIDNEGLKNLKKVCGIL